ncbi:MAG: transcriptional repressor [Planctomycetota bacterium]|nr:transcriptional repressor [Planctomycetota bacterium]
MTERRDTAQQRAIREVCQSTSRPLSIDEILRLAQSDVPSLGQRTVYRIVRRMVEDGLLVPVAVSGQPDRYEWAEVAASHHHHFHCTVCDRMFDVEGCVGKLASLLPRGFTLEDHELTLRGRCKSCSD